MSARPRPYPKRPGPPLRAHSFCGKVPGGAVVMSEIMDALPTVDSPTTLLTPDSPGRFIYGSQPMVRQHPSPRGKTLPLPVVSVKPIRPVFGRRRTSDTGEKEREAEKIEAFSTLGSGLGNRKVLSELDIVSDPSLIVSKTLIRASPSKLADTHHSPEHPPSSVVRVHHHRRLPSLSSWYILPSLYQELQRLRYLELDSRLFTVFLPPTGYPCAPLKGTIP